MEALKLNLSSWKQWCRLCGSSDTLEDINIKDLDEEFFINLFLLFSIDIENLEFSSNICSDCLEFFMKVLKFKEKVEKTNEKFEKIEKILSKDCFLSDQDEDGNFESDESVEQPNKCFNCQKINSCDCFLKEQKENVETIQKKTENVNINIKTSSKISTESLNVNSTYWSDSEEEILEKKKKRISWNYPEDEIFDKKKKTKKELQQLGYHFCPICDKAIKHSWHLPGHMLTHDDQRKDNICPGCEKTFKCIKSFRKHIYSYIQWEKYQCPICPKRFTDSENCRDHVISMHPEELKKMQEQGFKLNNKTLLMPMKKIIETVAIMNGNAGTINSFVNSEAINETEIKAEDYSFNCETDRDGYIDETTIDKHNPSDIFAFENFISGENDYSNEKKLNPSKKKKNMVKPRKIGKFICDACGKEFRCKDYLKEHFLQNHTDLKEYVCPLCEKACKLRKTLHRHMYFHMEVKQYKCRFCPKLFYERRNCNIHSLKHHPKQSEEITKQRQKLYAFNLKMSYKELIEACTKLRQEVGDKYIVAKSKVPKSGYRKCNICNKEFRKKLYWEHVRRHTHPDEFKCPDCNKTYTRKFNLRFHVQTVHNKLLKPHQCPYCNENFKFLLEMNSHIKNNHPNEAAYSLKQENLINDANDNNADWSFQEFIEVNTELDE